MVKTLSTDRDYRSRIGDGSGIYFLFGKGVMYMSTKDSLNQADLLKWAKNTFLFAIPTFLAFLGALQGSMDFKIAVGMATGTLISSSIDLLRKYSAGTETITSQDAKQAVMQ